MEVCDCFKQLITKEAVKFYTPDDGETLIMPHIPNSHFKYNNCPCCGSETRKIVFTRMQLDKIRETINH